MLSVEEAQQRILAAVPLMGSEAVPLPTALGRILAKAMIAGGDHPPWDNSAMDGYAVRRLETKGASPAEPVRLQVIETIPAGRMPQKTILPGTAAKIMTGAPLPEGADAVVKVEDTKQEGEEVWIYKEANPDFIRHRGEGVKTGDTGVEKGTRIRSYELAMIASLGVSEVPVYKPPRVAIISTGNELVDLYSSRQPHQIYNSNGYGLSAQVTEAGGIPIPLGIVSDSREALMDKLKEATRADFILISGGVSMGDYDFVKELFSYPAPGIEPFWKVAMKPGKPLAFGLLSGKVAWGLPGNPVSAMVTFEQFVRPALIYAQGSALLFRPTLRATLTEDIQKEAGKRYFIRGRLFINDGIYQVAPTGDQDSGNLLSLVQANALIVLGEEEKEVKAGRAVSVQMLETSHLDTKYPVRLNYKTDAIL